MCMALCYINSLILLSITNRKIRAHALAQNRKPNLTSNFTTARRESSHATEMMHFLSELFRLGPRPDGGQGDLSVSETVSPCLEA